MNPTGAGVLQVEPTDHCNLRCRMCAPHFEGWGTVHGVPKGFLDPELWDRVLAGIVDDGLRFDHLIFQWLGDPSLHPELPRLIGAAARALKGQVNYLRVDTNGILLTPEKMDALVDQVGAAGGPPLLVVFTLDAATPATYAHVKGQDALPRVLRNVRRLVRARRAAAAPINLQLQFVVQPGNAHEVRPFLQHWADLLACQGDPARWRDELMFKRLSVAGGGPGQAAADALYERALAGVEPGRVGGLHVDVWQRRPWQRDDAHPDAPRGACPGLWLTPVIRHDGVLLMCCADLHSQLALGDLRQHGLRALWEGPAATAHRLDHLAGRFAGPCAGCGGINWYTLTPEMAEAARSRGRALGLTGLPAGAAAPPS
jgi:MoaA/NifB/PqqE/SkfB family radical SAM enzyme